MQVHSGITTISEFAKKLDGLSKKVAACTVTEMGEGSVVYFEETDKTKDFNS